MKRILYVTGLLFLLSCVPIKKYRELESNYHKCIEEQELYKSKSIDYENQVKELNVQLTNLRSGIEVLVADTTRIGEEYRLLKTDHAKILDRLNELEKELNARSRALDEKEKRINELESVIASKDEAVRILKEKISSALRGFADKGITVEERNGRIYVSLEAQLLFASGKTDVSKEGQVALIDLAKVLETQKDIDILVEGHTDVDPMNSSTSPKDNWELSVLRATSVVKIMLSNSAMDPKRITAGGRSEYVPLDPNNKAKNRRIEIIITPDLTHLFELISTE